MGFLALTPWWKELQESQALEEESEAEWSQICLLLRKNNKENPEIIHVPATRNEQMLAFKSLLQIFKKRNKALQS